MNWHELAITSHYQAAVAIKQEWLHGNIEEAMAGLEELIEALSRSDKRALRSYLIQLIAHTIKWKTQPEQRSRSWIVSIEKARIEIEELLELEPSLKPLIPNLLKELFEKAKRLAEKEMGKKTPLTELSWSEVFEEDYTLCMLRDQI